MAKTVELRTKVEPFIRKELEKSYPGHTFTAKVTSRNFVEVHHLIPMAFQDAFNHSLDVPANIIAACPNCHRQLHHAEKNEIADVVQRLLESREGVMQQAGISTPIGTLFKYYRLN